MYIKLLDIIREPCPYAGKAERVLLVKCQEEKRFFVEGKESNFVLKKTEKENIRENLNVKK